MRGAEDWRRDPAGTESVAGDRCRKPCKAPCPYSSPMTCRSRQTSLPSPSTCRKHPQRHLSRAAP
eukprot:1435910-Prymnesium_polylepis.2